MGPIGVACGSDGGYSGGAGEGGGGPGTSSPPPIATPTVGALGVEIVRVELNQASAAVLAKGGEPTPQKDIVAPVVGGRTAFAPNQVW